MYVCVCVSNVRREANYILIVRAALRDMTRIVGPGNSANLTKQRETEGERRKRVKMSA